MAAVHITQYAQNAFPLNRLVKKLSHNFVFNHVCRALIKILNAYPISRALSMPCILF